MLQVLITLILKGDNVHTITSNCVIPTIFNIQYNIMYMLTFQEFCKIYKRFFPFGDSAPFASLLFDRFQLNQNGQLEFREFVISLSIAARGSLEEKLICEC